MRRITLLGCLATILSAMTVLPARAEPAPAAAAQGVDRLLAEELFSGETKPAAQVDDETFLRRASLDLVGDLPAPETIAAFALDPSPDKRTRAVERLLADEHFGQNWARYWRDVILARRTEDRALLVANPLVVYLTEQFNQNRPWNEIATDFITARGDVRQDGETAIVVAQDGETEETAAEMSRVFLGIQIQCAQCHNHFSDRWTREQFHEFAAFFPRIAVRPKRSLTERTLIVTADDFGFRGRRKTNGRRGAPEHYMQDLENPTAAGSLMKPVFFLNEKELPLGTPDDRRRGTVAKWMTEDPWFAKAFVNRIWAEMTGQGFYEPVDDLGPDRTPRAPQTIEYLASAFVESGYDVKWLFRTIARTEAYQRRSRPRSLPGETVFAASCQKRLRSDQLFSALTRALGIDERTANRNRGRGAYAALQTPRIQFASIFGFDPSLPADEISGSIPQALALMNSPTINSLINGRSSRTMLGSLLRDVNDDEAVVVELYLRTLAREPKQSELTTCLKHVRTVEDRVEAFEDILWALLNSTEFLHRR